MAEIASHIVQQDMSAIRLHDGPWDGKEVGVRDPEVGLVQVNGPRNGNHRIWVTHFYERRGDRYEFVSTEIVPLSGWSAWRGTKLPHEPRAQ